jgi:PKD repeat protein
MLRLWPLFLIVAMTAFAGAALAMPSAGGEGAPIQYFVKNMGQYPPDILYYADLQGGRLYIRAADIVFQFVEASGAPAFLKPGSSALFQPREECSSPSRRFANVYVRFEGSDFSDMRAEGELGTRLNIFKGRDPAGWFTGIPVYSRIVVPRLYPGAALVFEAGKGAQSFWTVETGDGDAAGIEALMQVDAGHPILPRERNLLVESGFGLFSIPRPGARMRGAEPVASNAASAADPQQVQWATYLGGSDDDALYGMVLDPLRKVIVCGSTHSSSLPVPNGYDGTFNGDWDGYAAELSADGSSLLWATFLGGSRDDTLYAPALDASLNVTLAGSTGSLNIPVPGGVQTSFRGGTSDGYVARLSPDGNRLLWGTYLGGASGDGLWTLALDGSGNAVVGGNTCSSDIPSPGGAQTGLQGGSDGYAAALASAGDTILWGTHLGGSGDDFINTLALDSGGNVAVGGLTNSANFPVPNGYDTSYNGGDAYGDGFAAKLSSTGSALLWATYLGGTEDDFINALALDSSGNVVVGGMTWSSDIPVPGGYAESYQGGGDGWLAKLASGGGSLPWGTYLGGSGADGIYALALDSAGNVFAGGITLSCDIPVPDGFDTACGAGDGYAARLSADGSDLLWGTYLGGSQSDRLFALALDPGGNILAAGVTASSDFPVHAGFDTSFNGRDDGFVARVTDPTATVQAPKAGFVSSPAYPAVGQTVQFTDTSLENPTSWSWDFGDGGTSALQNPPHAFSTAGSHSVRLTAANAAGSDSITKSVVTGYPPQAAFSFTPANPIAAQPVQFTDASTQAPASWTWTFGDGGTSSLQSPAHAFACPGTYGVNLTAANAYGNGSVQHSVAVAGSTALFRDGFESGGWSMAQVSGTTGKWTWPSAGLHPAATPHGGAKLADFNAYTAAVGSKTRMYRSTGFSVPSSSASVTLTFFMYHDNGKSGYNDQLQPQVSTNGITWVNAGSAIARYAATSGWVQHSVDLTSYKGQTNLRIAFLGISAHGNDVYVDDVGVTNLWTPSATYTVSGTVGLSTGGGAAGASVALSGASTASATTGAAGGYSFACLLNGSYTVTPALSGYVISPASRTVSVAGADVPGVDFTAAACGVNTAAYNTANKAPTCSTAGSGCDTGSSLIHCKSASESNYPNTVHASCADGTSGTCGSYESVERLSVATSDGSCLAVGRTVTVTAKVYCRSTTTDYVAFYYAATVPASGAPTWKSAGTPSRCPGTGLQTVTRTLALTGSAGAVQAVRAQIVNGTSPLSACQSGVYNDRDDLIFKLQ